MMNSESDINKQGLMASLQYYEKAIAADSNFAEAYAGLANSWYNLCAWGWYKPYYEGVQKALYFSNKALEIDPDCSEAHAVKGVYLYLSGIQTRRSPQGITDITSVESEFFHSTSMVCPVADDNRTH